MKVRVKQRARPRRRDGRFDRRAAARASEEAGFSLIETTVALGLVFTVMIGLLASLSTGIRGLTTGRQRTVGVSLAKEVVERARAADYDEVGHDYNDPTLATDPAVTVDAEGTYYYEPGGADGPEPLVSSGVDAIYGIHEWRETRDGVDLTVRVYVTEVSPTVGDDHKRVTIDVSWADPAYATGSVPNAVVVSTFVSPFDASVSGSGSGTGGSGGDDGGGGGGYTDEAYGVVDVDSGVVGITGTLDGLDLSRAQLFLPAVHGDTSSDLVAETHGHAGSARSSVELNSGSASGCGTSGGVVECDGVKADTVADNDAGTDPEPAARHVDGPKGDLGSTITAGSPLSVSLGATGSVVSRSAAVSCATCSDPPPVGDSDGFPYADDHADGPGSMAAGFEAGILSGNLVGSDAAGWAAATIDQDPVTGGSLVTSVGNLVVPEVDLVTLSLAPMGFTSAVNVSGVDVTATAEAGPTASTPSVTGSTITVSMYETDLLGVGSYTSTSFNPGDTVAETATATFDVLDSVLGITNTVTLETTVSAGSANTSHQTDGSSTITEAEANLTNWFTVQVRLVIEELGTTVADLTVELDYGRVVASAEVVL